MKSVISFILFSLVIFSSCDKNKNGNPSINIYKILKNQEVISPDDIKISNNDTLKIIINLKAEQKDINSFTTKFKELENYMLTITDIDESTTYIEGNPIATAYNEDCTVLFKDGTYDTQITIKTVIKNPERESAKLYLYLFSEKDTATKEIDIKLDSGK